MSNENIEAKNTEAVNTANLKKIEFLNLWEKQNKTLEDLLTIAYYQKNGISYKIISLQKIDQDSMNGTVVQDNSGFNNTQTEQKESEEILLKADRSSYKKTFALILRQLKAYPVNSKTIVEKYINYEKWDFGDKTINEKDRLTFLQHCIMLNVLNKDEELQNLHLLKKGSEVFYSRIESCIKNTPESADNTWLKFIAKSIIAEVQAGTNKEGNLISKNLEEYPELKQKVIEFMQIQNNNLAKEQKFYIREWEKAQRSMTNGSKEYSLLDQKINNMKTMPALRKIDSVTELAADRIYSAKAYTEKYNLVFCKERNVNLKIGLSALAFALAPLTLGVSILAASAISYKKTGSAAFWNPHASADKLKKQYEKLTLSIK